MKDTSLLPYLSIQVRVLCMLIKRWVVGKFLLVNCVLYDWLDSLSIALSWCMCLAFVQLGNGESSPNENRLKFAWSKYGISKQINYQPQQSVSEFYQTIKTINVLIVCDGFNASITIYVRTCVYESSLNASY